MDQFDGDTSPKIKLVYIKAGGELRKIGPKYLLKHYESTYKLNIIKVQGYSIKGNKQIVDMKVEINITKDILEQTLHHEFAKFLI